MSNPIHDLGNNEGFYEIQSTFWKGLFLIFFWFFLICAVIFLLGFFVPFLNPGAGGSMIALLILVTAGCVLLAIFPFKVGLKAMMVKVVPPQPFRNKEETIKELLNFNNEELPIKISQTEKYDLIIESKLNDDQWREILFKGGLKRDYSLYLKLDEKIKTAFYCEKTKEISWINVNNLTQLKAKGQFNFFYGIMLIDKKKLILSDPYQGFKRLATINSDISEIRNPLFGILLKNGWNLEPRLFPFQVRKTS